MGRNLPPPHLEQPSLPPSPRFYQTPGSGIAPPPGETGKSDS